ncbi:MAG: hypothetical protein SOR38_10615 [Oscillospiraceae bacterium]|nr:hypothetical protein [Oscillospiraceae bacterium]MDY3066236.1 hypothetical protein [Oscillospiraceae bacterium]
MKQAKTILRKLLYPPKEVLYFLSPVVFVALIFVFAVGKQGSWPAYLIYSMSVYSLIILVAALLQCFRCIKKHISGSKAVEKLSSYAAVNRYLTDLSFKGKVSIYQGMTVNILYALFRTITGIMYSSVWFISMAVYHFVLYGMRAYLIVAFKNRDAKADLYEYSCYGKIARFLFLLNIPMGGMIWLMIKTNSGFSYPGYVIYLSALYTFCTMGMSIGNLVKFKKLGSPILSAAKMLNFVSAMMSVLGLQTAMISAFSTNGEEYRKLMNTLTGSLVYGTVVIIAVYMIIKASVERKKVVTSE